MTQEVRPDSFAGLPPDIDEQSVFRSLFAAYPDALLLVDQAGKIVLANPAAALLLGYETHEIVGLNVDVLVPDSIRPRHASYREAYARAPRPRAMGTQMELVAKRRDGSEVMVEIALSPLQNQGLPFVVAAIRDIGGYPRVKQAVHRASYSEHLARLGRLAVDMRDSQDLLHQAPRIATEALQVEAALVALLTNDGLEFRIASASGMLVVDQVGQTALNNVDTLVGMVLAAGTSVHIDALGSENRFPVPEVRTAFSDWRSRPISRLMASTRLPSKIGWPAHAATSAS